MFAKIVCDYRRIDDDRADRKQNPLSGVGRLSITLFGDDAGRTEVRQSCDQRDDSQIEPYDSRVIAVSDQCESDYDSDGPTYFSHGIDIHFVLLLIIFDTIQIPT